MNDRSQTSRQLFILERLSESKGGLTIQQLHDKVCSVHCDISERTIRRDIDQLSIDFAIEEKSVGKLFIYKLNKFDLQKMSFTMKDLYALAFTKVMLADYTSNEIYKNATSIIDKILIRTTNSNKRTISFIENALIIRSAFTHEKELDTELMQLLLNAIVERKAIKITYYSFNSDETSLRVVEPYHLAIQEGKLHLVAFCRLRNGLRDFRVSRIKNVDLTVEIFETKAKLLTDFADKRFINIVGERIFNMILKFTPNKARYILEYEEQKADKTEIRDDGSLLFYKKTALSIEVVEWILKYGHHVEVIEPEELRDTIVNEIEQMNLVYK